MQISCGLKCEKACLILTCCTNERTTHTKQNTNNLLDSDFQYEWCFCHCVVVVCGVGVVCCGVVVVWCGGGVVCSVCACVQGHRASEQGCGAGVSVCLCFGIQVKRFALLSVSVHISRGLQGEGLLCFSFSAKKSHIFNHLNKQCTFGLGFRSLLS